MALALALAAAPVMATPTRGAVGSDPVTSLAISQADANPLSVGFDPTASALIPPTSPMRLAAPGPVVGAAPAAAGESGGKADAGVNDRVAVPGDEAGRAALLKRLGQSGLALGAAATGLVIQGAQGLTQGAGAVLLGAGGAVTGTVDVLQDASQRLVSGAADLVGGALGLLGVPYRRGGTNADTGFDCSGFVQTVFENTLGLVLPRSAAQQAAATQTIDLKDLKPGDLVFFNTMRRAFSHVGIYIGDGQFVHAPRAGAQVRVESMDLAYWKRRFNGARRVQGAQDTPPTPELR